MLAIIIIVTVIIVISVIYCYPYSLPHLSSIAVVLCHLRPLLLSLVVVFMLVTKDLYR